MEVIALQEGTPQERVLISTAVFILLASAAIFCLALETHPLWGTYSHTPAQVTDRVGVHSGKSTSCDVWLRFTLDGRRTRPRLPILYRAGWNGQWSG